MLRKAVEHAPGGYKTRIALANFYMTANPPNLEQAESQARDALKLDTERVDAYGVLARIYAGAGRWSAVGFDPGDR